MCFFKISCIVFGTSLCCWESSLHIVLGCLPSILQKGQLAPRASCQPLSIVSAPCKVQLSIVTSAASSCLFKSLSGCHLWQLIAQTQQHFSTRLLSAEHLPHHISSPQGQVETSCSLLPWSSAGASHSLYLTSTSSLFRPNPESIYLFKYLFVYLQ